MPNKIEGIELSIPDIIDQSFYHVDADRRDMLVYAAEEIENRMTDEQIIDLQTAGDIYRGAENVRSKIARIQGDAGTLIREASLPFLFVEPTESADVTSPARKSEPQTERVAGHTLEGLAERVDGKVQLTGIIASVDLNPFKGRTSAVLTVSQAPTGGIDESSTPPPYDIVASINLANIIHRNTGVYAEGAPVSIVGYKKVREPSREYPMGGEYVLATKMKHLKNSTRPTAS